MKAHSRQQRKALTLRSHHGTGRLAPTKSDFSVARVVATETFFCDVYRSITDRIFVRLQAFGNRAHDTSNDVALLTFKIMELYFERHQTSRGRVFPKLLLHLDSSVADFYIDEALKTFLIQTNPC